MQFNIIQLLPQTKNQTANQQLPTCLRKLIHSGLDQQVYMLMKELGQGRRDEPSTTCIASQTHLAGSATLRKNACCIRELQAKKKTQRRARVLQQISHD